MPFTLYPEEQHWWSFRDYQAVLDVMRHLQPRRVLEFGPGSSTLALIEGGAQHIDSCEDQSDWLDVYEARLARRFPRIVRLHAYRWRDPLFIEALEEQVYDLALIDGPHGTEKRHATIAYALERSAAVLVPTEDLKPGDKGLRSVIAELAERYGRHVEIMETGPHSGAFALMTMGAS